jgi:hypothetical protein
MALTRQLVAQIQREINEALAAVAAKHNLTLEPSRARYSDSNLKVTLELSVQTESGEPADFRYGAAALCLPADCWGKTVMINGKFMTICGIKLRNRKYPVLAIYQGKTYKLTSESVSRALKAAA